MDVGGSQVPPLPPLTETYGPRSPTLQSRKLCPAAGPRPDFTAACGETRRWKDPRFTSISRANFGENKSFWKRRRERGGPRACAALTCRKKRGQNKIYFFLNWLCCQLHTDKHLCLTNKCYYFKSNHISSSHAKLQEWNLGLYRSFEMHIYAFYTAGLSLDFL